MFEARELGLDPCRLGIKLRFSSSTKVLVDDARDPGRLPLRDGINVPSLSSLLLVIGKSEFRNIHEQKSIDHDT